MKRASDPCLQYPENWHGLTVPPATIVAIYCYGNGSYYVHNPGSVKYDPGIPFIATRCLRSTVDDHILSNLGTCTHKVQTYSVDLYVRMDGFIILTNVCEHVMVKLGFL